jgi:hypothetical protein
MIVQHLDGSDRRLGKSLVAHCLNQIKSNQTLFFIATNNKRLKTRGQEKISYTKLMKKLGKARIPFPTFTPMAHFDNKTLS